MQKPQQIFSLVVEVGENLFVKYFWTAAEKSIKKMKTSSENNLKSFLNSIILIWIAQSSSIDRIWNLIRGVGLSEPWETQDFETLPNLPFKYLLLLTCNHLNCNRLSTLTLKRLLSQFQNQYFNLLERQWRVRRIIAKEMICIQQKVPRRLPSGSPSELFSRINKVEKEFSEQWKLFEEQWRVKS